MLFICLLRIDLLFVYSLTHGGGNIRISGNSDGSASPFNFGFHVLWVLFLSECLRQDLISQLAWDITHYLAEGDLFYNVFTFIYSFILFIYVYMCMYVVHTQATTHVV